MTAKMIVRSDREFRVARVDMKGLLETTAETVDPSKLVHFGTQMCRVYVDRDEFSSLKPKFYQKAEELGNSNNSDYVLVPENPAEEHRPGYNTILMNQPVTLYLKRKGLFG